MIDKESDLHQLYQDVIMDHQKEPRNFGTLSDATLEREGYNPVCGDRVFLQVKLEKGDQEARVGEIRFRGEGCSICMASASMMTEEVEGHPVSQVSQQIESFRQAMQGNGEITKDPESDLAALSGVRRFPVRIKCALLPWVTLKEMVEMNGEAKR